MQLRSSSAGSAAWLAAMLIGGLGGLLPSHNANAAEPTTAPLAEQIAACEAGAGNPCTLVGMRYVNGDGVGADPEAAVAWFERACAAGDPYGCNNVGNMLSVERGLPLDFARAFDFYQRACALQLAEGCSNVGYAQERGEGTPADTYAARASYLRGCELGRLESCTAAGLLNQQLQDGGAALSNSRHYSQKLMWDQACRRGFAKACELARGFQRPPRFAPVWAPAGIGERFLDCLDGVAHACYRVAGVLEGDDYVDAIDISRMDQVPTKTRDFETARLFYRRACDLGEAVGCADLGVDYLQGNQVAASPRLALELFIEACDLGYGLGCANAGAMFKGGHGIATDTAAAGLYAHKGCELGSRRGCETRARLWPEEAANPWLPRNPATQALRRACAGDDADACQRLAAAYQAGDGAPNSPVLAAGYQARACTLGHAGACHGLALRYQQGDGVTKNLLRARDHFEIACNSGVTAACSAQVAGATR